jgi:glycosyltransferase involved in cell wall biosynthesis
VGPLRILHLHSSFALGGKEARAVRLMNAFGDRAVHSIVSGVPGQLGARDAIAPGVAVAFPDNAPALAGTPSVGRLRALAAFMSGFDLILTYNWGAIDGVMSRRLFGGPPLIHHEDGFNADEAARLMIRRNLYRRVALEGAQALVVPSHRLERIARDIWRQPAARVARIDNGVPLDRVAAAPLPGFVRRPGVPVVGAVAGLRPVKNLTGLVRAFAACARDADLVIVGEGPERLAIEAEARRLGVADRVHLPGFIADPIRHLGQFDIFALASLSEQAPIALAEAMAAGLPVAATNVGDVAAMLAPANHPFVVDSADDTSLAGALAALIDDPAARSAIGAANRAAAGERFDERHMIGAYAALYAGAAGRPGSLGWP